MTTTPRYVHGTHPEEQRRLADLVALIHRASLAALAPQTGEGTLVDFCAGDALAMSLAASAEKRRSGTRSAGRKG